MLLVRQFDTSTAGHSADTYFIEDKALSVQGYKKPY
jgi:hypothetical protein